MSKSKYGKQWFETQEQKLRRLLHEVKIPVTPKQKSEPTLDPNKKYSTLIYAAFSKSDTV